MHKRSFRREFQIKDVNSLFVPVWLYINQIQKFKTDIRTKQYHYALFPEITAIFVEADIDRGKEHAEFE